MADDPHADPNDDSELFRRVPAYVTCFDDARTVAPSGLELSLRQRGEERVATYLDADEVEVSRGSAPTPARATLLAAPAARVGAVPTGRA